MPDINRPKATVLLCGLRDANILGQAVALAEQGVTLEWVSPEDLHRGFDDGSMPARIRAATICIIGKGMREAEGVALLQLRSDRPKTTWTAAGLCTVGRDAFKLVYGKASPYVPIPQSEMPLLLREVFGIALPPPEVITDRILPAVPKLYRADPDALTRKEFSNAPGERIPAMLSADRLSPEEMIAEGWAGGRLLENLLRKTPSDELHVLGLGGVGRIWERADADGTLEINICRALARDGGRLTLAALPEAYAARCATLRELWPDVIERTRQEMGVYYSNLDRLPYQPKPRDAILESTMIPCEDPLGPDADPNTFKPTLTTLRVARRYRPAGDVLVDARKRWGGRSFLSRHMCDWHLAPFVQESAPTSAADVAAWVRALNTLPDGRVRKTIVRGMVTWPVMEVEIVNTALQVVQQGLPDISFLERLPVWRADGTLIAEKVEAIQHEPLKQACLRLRPGYITVRR